MTQHDPYRTPEAPVASPANAPRAVLDVVVLAAALLQSVTTLVSIRSMLNMVYEGQLSSLMVLLFWLSTLLLVLAGLLLFWRNRAAAWLFLLAAAFGGLALLLPWPLWLPHITVGVALLGAVAGFRQGRKR